MVRRPGLAASTTIFEWQDTTPSSAWTFLNYKVEITAPPAVIPANLPGAGNPDTQKPYRIEFYVHGDLSTTPPDVFRNGVAVPACAALNSTTASPDPCVSRHRTLGAEGNPNRFHVIEVNTTRASEWTFGVPRKTAGATLGALRTSSGGDVAFGVTSNGASVAGAFAYNKGSEHFVATGVTALAITGKKAWFAGVGRDRRPFLAYVEDNGPGSRDVFKLWIAGMEQTGTGGLKAGDLSVLAKR